MCKYIYIHTHKHFQEPKDEGKCSSYSRALVVMINFGVTGQMRFTLNSLN